MAICLITFGGLAGNSRNCAALFSIKQAGLEVRYTDMSDYAISVKVRNGRIKRKIAECGFSSVGDLCRKSGLHPHRIGDLLNLKLPPLTGHGRWRRSAAALAEALGCTCEDLFSETQRTLALRGNHGECLITETGLLKLFGKVERPLLENPGERLLEDADEQTKIRVIRRALNGLNPRDRRFIESHFGIGCEGRTLADLAVEHDVSYHFVLNRLNRALQRLRGDKLAARRSLLQAYQPADAMGTADEARVRMARKRVAVLPAESRAEAPRQRTMRTPVSMSDRV
jgi:DNA-directed RNA polymerase specialized sigma24 family protein